MRLKSFHAPSMVEAMRLVRDALGDDAIIVATREEEGGVRLTAAIDDVEEPLLPPSSSRDPEPVPGAHRLIVRALSGPGLCGILHTYPRALRGAWPQSCSGGYAAAILAG